jgi:hypothetical protein
LFLFLVFLQPGLTGSARKSEVAVDPFGTAFVASSVRLNMGAAVFLGARTILFGAGVVLAVKQRWQIYKSRGFAAAVHSEQLSGPGVPYLAKQLGGTVHRVPEGYVVTLDGSGYLHPTLSKAGEFLRDIKPAEGKRPAVSATEPLGPEDAPTNETRQNKRLMWRLVIW